MTEVKRRIWKWLKRLALVAVALFLVVVYALTGFRKPWVEPLLGVRLDPTLPFLKESDLGPESAYKLLLRAVKPPVDAALDSDAAPVWRHDWTDALTKLELHRWPTKPPPPAPVGGEDDAPSVADGVGEMGDVLSPDPDLFRDDPALDPEAPWTLEQVQDIQRLRKLYEPNVAILDQALAAPNPQVPTADSPGFLLLHLKDVRAQARWLSISAQYKAAIGDYAGSSRDLLRTVRMGNLTCRGGGMIEHIVGIACQVIAADAASLVASRHHFPAPILKKTARELLASADDAEPFAECIRVEALVTKTTVSMVYRADLSMFMDTSGGRPEIAVPLRRPGFLFLRLIGSTPEKTQRNLDYCYQHLVALAKQPYSRDIQDKYDDFTGGLSAAARPVRRVVFRAQEPLGLLLAGILLPSLSREHGKAAQRDAVLRGAALFLAIKAYEKEHGAPPERLAELVPDYLPRVPKDPFDGKPFRYLRNGVPGLPLQAWAVYSIGKDFTDDGGKAHSVGQARSEHGPNPDLVWPSREYPKPPPPP